MKCWQILENVETVLAIELLTAAQGLDFRQPLKAGRGPAAAHRAVRGEIPHAERDRAFGEDIATAIRLVRSGAVVGAVEGAVGALI